MSSEAFAKARAKVKANLKSVSGMSQISPSAHSPESRFYLDLACSAERWPYHRELQCCGTGSKTFDTQTCRYIIAPERFAMFGWLAVRDLDFCGFNQSQCQHFIGQAIELPQLAALYFAYLPLILPDLKL